METIGEGKIVTIDIGLTPAEQSEFLIADCCKDIKVRFLELGGLLADNQDRALWSEHHESFKDFIELLGIGSYSWVMRLIDISRLVATQLLTKEEVLEIGVAKACLLLPRAKKGQLDDDIKELAKNAPYHELRLGLGHRLTEGESGEYLFCPRCGVDITLHKGMIRRR